MFKNNDKYNSIAKIDPRHALLLTQPKILTTIKAFFTQFKALVGQPNFVHKTGKIVIQIPYFISVAPVGHISDVGHRPASSNGLPTEKMNALGLAITSLVRKSNLNKLSSRGTREQDKALNNGAKDSINYINASSPVVELRFVQLRYPYLDSSILAQYIAMNAGKYNFLRIKKMLFNKVTFAGNLRIGGSLAHSAVNTEIINADTQNIGLPSYLTGLKMELAGRLTTQRSIPRKTVSSVHKGSLQKSTVKNNTHYSSKTQVTNFNQYASKNKVGAYTMKVWLSQRS